MKQLFQPEFLSSQPEFSSSQPEFLSSQYIGEHQAYVTRAEFYVTFRDNSRTEFDVTICGNSPDIITRTRGHFGPLKNDSMLWYLYRVISAFMHILQHTPAGLAHLIS